MDKLIQAVTDDWVRYVTESLERNEPDIFLELVAIDPRNLPEGVDPDDPRVRNLVSRIRQQLKASP